MTALSATKQRQAGVIARKIVRDLERNGIDASSGPGCIRDFILESSYEYAGEVLGDAFQFTDRGQDMFSELRTEAERLVREIAGDWADVDGGVEMTAVWNVGDRIGDGGAVWEITGINRVREFVRVVCVESPYPGGLAIGKPNTYLFEELPGGVDAGPTVRRIERGGLVSLDLRGKTDDQVRAEVAALVDDLRYLDDGKPYDYDGSDFILVWDDLVEGGVVERYAATGYPSIVALLSHLVCWWEQLDCAPVAASVFRTGKAPTDLDAIDGVSVR